MGLVVDEKLARDTGCTCHAIGKTYKPKDLMCFSPGVIGTLTDEQDAELCTKGKLIMVADGIRERIKRFKRASEVCERISEKYPKGEKLIPRIECMKEELKK